MDLDRGRGVGEQIKQGLGFFVINGYTGEGVTTRLEKLEGSCKGAEIAGGGAVGLGFKVDIPLKFGD